MKQGTMEVEKIYSIYFDASATRNEDGESGTAGIAYVIRKGVKRSGTILFTKSEQHEYLEVTHKLEYAALVAATTAALIHVPEGASVHFYGDCGAAISLFKKKRKFLQRSMNERFNDVEFTKIRKKRNTEAHKLALKTNRAARRAAKVKHGDVLNQGATAYERTH
jgi:ribonuclease HI